MRLSTCKWLCIGVAVLCLILLILLFYVFKAKNVYVISNFIHQEDAVHDTDVKSDDFRKKNLIESCISGKTLSKLNRLHVKMYRTIQKAKIHIRGTKSRKFVVEALTVLTELLNMTGTSTKELKRPTYRSKHVCKEVYKGTGYGYPYYERGFERENCSYAVQIENIVTIVVLLTDDLMEHARTLLQGIMYYNNRIKVIVGTWGTEWTWENAIYSNMLFKEIPRKFSLGKALNFLIEQIKTEYVLVSRNITYFNNDSRLERLVHEIESLGVTVVGGASRDKDGFWKIGCYQTVYRNYTLVYEEGYDESLHECIFCDFLTGPFITRKSTLVKYKFDENMGMSSVINDFFIRLSRDNKESVVCPDSMFYVHRTKLSNKASAWSDLADKYNLYRFRFAGEFDIVFKCSNKKLNCNKYIGYAVHPCCLQDLVDVTKFAMKLCDESGIICELDSGTLLGAVKFYSILPWERDSDLVFVSDNFTALSNLKNKVPEQYNFEDDEGESIKCCTKGRKSGGYVQLRSKYWRLEFYGEYMLPSETLLKNGFKPTKILLDGQWVSVPRNPGLFSRNRYGHEIYAHAGQHWGDAGAKSSWILYRSNYFIPCITPGRHDCLDYINSDGNLQFKTPII